MTYKTIILSAAIATALAAQAQPTQWVAMGEGQFTEDILTDTYSYSPVTYAVTVEADAAASGWYRIVNPMADNPSLKIYGDGQVLADKDYYIVINATNPAAVQIQESEIGFEDGYGAYSVMSFPTGQLADGVITFTESGDIILIQDEDEYDGNANGAFRLVLPEKQAQPMTLPYDNPLNTDGALDGFTVIDTNRDGITWEQTYLKTVAISYNDEMPMDDWLILPPVQLIGGSKYAFSVDVLPGSSSMDERFEVKMGTAPTAEAMTQTVIERQDAAHGMYKAYTGTLAPEEDGTYYVGIHACSVPDTYGITIRNLSIGEAKAPVVPAPPTDLVVTTRTNGFLGADVTLKAPETDLEGNPLPGLTYIRVYRDGAPCHTVMNPATGADISFVTEVPENGRYTYSAVAENAAGTSPAVEVNAFVGVLEPATPTNVTVAKTEREDILLLTWDPVTSDIRGNELLPEYVTYRVYHARGFRAGDDKLVAEDLAEPRLEVEIPLVDCMCQWFEQYEVVAVNAGGISDFAPSNNLAVGVPPQAPFAESFANGLSELKIVNLDGHEAKWDIYTDDATLPSYDNDGGYMASQANFIDDTAGAITTQVDLARLDKPALSFWTYKLMQDGQNGNTLTMKVGDKEIANVELDNIDGPQGWYQVIADLSEFKGQRVQFTFVSTHKIAPVVVVDHMLVDEADRVALHNILDDVTEGDAQYFDLLGRPVTHPAPGTVVIRRIGNKTDKTIR